MKKNRLRKLIFEHIVIMFGTAFIFFGIFIVVNRFIGTARDDTQSYLLSGKGQAIINDDITKYLNNKEKKANYHTAVFEFPEDCKLVRKKDYDQIYSLKDKQVRQKINSDYPLIMGEGAYLYLYTDDFIVVTKDFAQEPVSCGAYLNNGAIYNQSRQFSDQNEVLLLKLPNGLYINSSNITLKYKSSIETVNTHSILKFYEGEVICCNIEKNSFKFNKIEIDDPLAIICIGEIELSYQLFYQKLEEGNNTSNEQMDSYSSSAALYQYFMGNRYDYTDTKTFYRNNDGYFMEYQDNRFMFDSAPLYYKNERKILLPCDYVLIQPKLFMMNKLPAMTVLQYKKGYVYVQSGDNLLTLSDFILFDGKDTYIFFNPTQINWKEEQLMLSAYSSVTVNEDGSVEIYNYAHKLYESYQVNGYQDIMAVMKDGTNINLSQDILYRPDGLEQILFSEPELLNEFK